MVVRGKNSLGMNREETTKVTRKKCVAFPVGTVKFLKHAKCSTQVLTPIPTFSKSTNCCPYSDNYVRPLSLPPQKKGDEIYSTPHEKLLAYEGKYYVIGLQSRHAAL
jgi:hypothetical protein